MNRKQFQVVKMKVLLQVMKVMVIEKMTMIIGNLKWLKCSSFFYEMITNIERLPGNNFKKGAELEIKKVIEIADQMKISR